MWYPSRRPASRAVGRLASRLCLLDIFAVCLDAMPCHLIISCLAACRSPLRASARASPCFVLVIDVGAAAVPPHCFSLPAPPHRHDGRGDTTGLRLFSRLCLLAPFGSPSHPCGSASDGDVALVLASLHVHHRCRLLPARSPNQIFSPSCRPAASSPPSPITRHGGRGGASWSRLLVFAVLFRLLSICVGSVYCGGGGCLACLNGVYLFLSMGDVVARRCVSGL